MPTPQHLLLLSADPVVARGARKAAKATDLEVTGPTDRVATSPVAIVIDLEQPGAIDQVAEFRNAHPDAFIAGHVSRPERDRWVEAERAGCDLVANRGALGQQLRTRLASRHGGRRRFPLLSEADLAGRLGFVARYEESPFGTLALYNAGGRVTIIDDVCPHAGERLSGGELNGCILTCPRHGSQFNVHTGERVRGPADQGVTSYEVLHESGRIQLVWSD
ncbi:MAG: Rieske (2Fe-2S) protein [Acidimicrobiales bacterium]